MRARSERGAASVEFAFLLPILLLLAVVAAEFGFAFADWLAISNATQSGARVVSAGADATSTDSAALDTIAAAAANAPRATVTSVEIFSVNSDGSQGATNRYVPSGGGWSQTQSGWPEASRDIKLATIDTAGVRVHWDHPWVIGFWSNLNASWSDSSVIRLQPNVGG